MARQKHNVYSILISFLVAIHFLAGLGNSSRILHISFMSSKSHKNVYEPLLVELGERGHSVTIVTPVASTKNYTNVHEIIGIPLEELMSSPLMKFEPFKLKEAKEGVNPFTTTVPVFKDYCPKFLNLPQVKEVLAQKFDLLILSAFMNECIYGIIPHFQSTPFVLITTFAAPYYITRVVGNPSPNSFSPFFIFGFKDSMSFVERTKNMLGHLLFDAVFNFYYNPTMEDVYRKHFGAETPGIEEIMKNTSLILSNGHFSLNFPRPMMPEIIDVGGMHCRPGQPLPKDLDDFISGGKDGVIYFSMGSLVKSSDMPPRILKLFLNTFAKLRQRILWKWETEGMEGETTIPSNIKLAKWLPQQDVLAHPNVKLFITHGGLLSTEEAVYHGKPLLGFPMFGDQEWNMENAKSLGFALSFDITEITEEVLLQALNQLLTDPRFQEKASSLSAIFRDRPMKPLDLAIYWTEYIIRHQGAAHLRSAARELNFFEYHSLDVIAFLSSSVFLTLYLVFAVFRFILRKMCCKSDKKSSALPTNKAKKIN